MARDAAGRSGEELLLPEGATVGAARDAIGEKFPALRPRLVHCRFAVDREFAALDASLHEGAELAVIPPVSGG
jgi:molybdopterin converting factor small subunit